MAYSYKQDIHTAPKQLVPAPQSFRDLHGFPINPIIFPLKNLHWSHVFSSDFPILFPLWWEIHFGIKHFLILSTYEFSHQSKARFSKYMMRNGVVFLMILLWLSHSAPRFPKTSDSPQCDQHPLAVEPGIASWLTSDVFVRGPVGGCKISWDFTHQHMFRSIGDHQ